MCVILLLWYTLDWENWKLITDSMIITNNSCTVVYWGRAQGQMGPGTHDNSCHSLWVYCTTRSSTHRHSVRPRWVWSRFSFIDSGDRHSRSWSCSVLLHSGTIACTATPAPSAGATEEWGRTQTLPSQAAAIHGVWFCQKSIFIHVHDVWVGLLQQRSWVRGQWCWKSLGLSEENAKLGSALTANLTHWC
jgi:hypothetical protein